MSWTEHQTPSRRCRYGIGADDDELFVCPLTREMVQFGNLLWETQRAGNRGPESFTEAGGHDAIYPCRR